MASQRPMPHGEADPRDVREYIHDMLGQLADLASAHGEPQLAMTLRSLAEEARDSFAN